MRPNILIACIGNIFLGDDAFGVEVARRLAERTLPEGVRLVDFGIRSYDLAYAMMEDWELIILVDAVPRGGAPGTVYVIEPELPAPDASRSPVLDAHTMNPVAALQMVALLSGGREFPARATAPDGTIQRIFVVGCEPSSADPEAAGMELSPPVRAAIEQAIRAIEQLIADFPAHQSAGAVHS